MEVRIPDPTVEPQLDLLEQALKRERVPAWEYRYARENPRFSTGSSIDQSGCPRVPRLCPVSASVDSIVPLELKYSRSPNEAPGDLELTHR